MVLLYSHPQSMYTNSRGYWRRLVIFSSILMLSPSLLICGFGIDFARAYMVQARLSRAVDAAALAGGRVFFDEHRDSHVGRFFDAAFPRDYLGAHPSPIDVTVDPNEGTLTVSARATVRRHFHELFGWGGAVLEASSRVHRASRNTEPVLERIR